MEKQFEIRTYGYGELAQLYFPFLTKNAASKKLTQWITESSNLCKSLAQTGWKKGNKTLTPKQVSILIGHLDPP